MYIFAAATAAAAYIHQTEVLLYIYMKRMKKALRKMLKMFI